MGTIKICDFHDYTSTSINLDDSKIPNNIKSIVIDFMYLGSASIKIISTDNVQYKYECDDVSDDFVININSDGLKEITNFGTGRQGRITRGGTVLPPNVTSIGFACGYNRVSFDINGTELFKSSCSNSGSIEIISEKMLDSIGV